MSAPRFHHILINPTSKMSAKFSLRYLLKRQKFWHRYNIQSTRLSSDNSTKETLPSEEKDIFGINEFYNSSIAKENPKPGLDKQVLMDKYSIIDQHKQKTNEETVHLPYGVVRLDPGVVDLFKKDQVNSTQDNSKPISRRKRKKVDSVANTECPNKIERNGDEETKVDDKQPRTQFEHEQLRTETSIDNYSEHIIRKTKSITPSSIHVADDFEEISKKERISSEMLYPDMNEQGTNIIDQQYFGDSFGIENNDTRNKITNESEKFSQNFIEDQYFEHDQKDDGTANENSFTDKKTSFTEKELRPLDEKALGFIDNLYFEHSESSSQLESSPQEKTAGVVKIKNKLASDVKETPENVFEGEFFSSQYSNDDEHKAVKTEYAEAITKLKATPTENYLTTEIEDNATVKNLKGNKSEMKQSVSMETEGKRLTTFTDQRQTVRTRNNPKSTAEEAASKIRQELSQKAKVVADPDRERKRQSVVLRQTMQSMTNSEIVKMLHDNIVYDRDDVIAINKPFGIASVDGPGMNHNIHGLLDKLRQRIDPDLNQLHLISHLDKDTTGVLLLARSETMALRLTDAFKKNEVQKKYLTVTKGVPKPEEGIVDIPMKEGKVEGRYRMVLRPQGYSNQAGTLKAVTQYKVLATSSGTAFVRCIPHTSVKHQIRAHLFYGLNTPILGDHKYSHMSKMAPQKLFPEILNRLQIRQAEVRYLPLHLHLWKLVIPEFQEGRNLNIHCRMPSFFISNMKRLKLHFKDHL